MLKQLYDTLSPVNLKSGFQVTGISPIVNRNKVLERLPGPFPRRDPGGEGTLSAMNDSVINLLESHCGLGQNRTNASISKKRGQKIVPGTRIAPESVAIESTTMSNEKWICFTAMKLGRKMETIGGSCVILAESNITFSAPELFIEHRIITNLILKKCHLYVTSAKYTHGSEKEC